MEEIEREGHSIHFIDIEKERKKKKSDDQFGIDMLIKYIKGLKIDILFIIWSNSPILFKIIIINEHGKYN